MDLDPDMLLVAKKNLEQFPDITYIHDSYSNID
jgi:hypothetical protein